LRAADAGQFTTVGLKSSVPAARMVFDRSGGGVFGVERSGAVVFSAQASCTDFEQET